VVPTKFNNFYNITGTGHSFDIAMKSSLRPHKSFHDELCLNAEYITANKDGNLYLFYSGGIDSEYILEIFLALKINITPVIVKLEPNLNTHDIDTAIEFCKSRNIKYLIIDINFEDFVNSGKFLGHAESVNCVVYQYPVLMEAALKLDGTILFGSDEPHFFKDLKTGLWYFDEAERIMAVWDRWYKKYNISGSPCFLSYSPETLLGYMDDPRFIDLSNNRCPGIVGTNSSKEIIYNRKVNMPLRKKLTGYEIIESLSIFQHPDIQKVKSDPFKNFDESGNGYYKILHSDLYKNLINTQKHYE
jgi:hypothetical protein